jgi:hypothetical protein
MAVRRIFPQGIHLQLKRQPASYARKCATQEINRHFDPREPSDQAHLHPVAAKRLVSDPDDSGLPFDLRGKGAQSGRVADVAHQ